ncbi:MAG: phosphoribosylformylglycinamidine synthase subunit PurQ, partial [Ignavibacteria bacterium]|nr:phosphoribosylformylglycinamidine synthase subunit PurQ [Ignavibacteria bacterium]
MKVGVVQFPGSNCDHDTYYLLKSILKLNTTFLFHKETSLQNCDLVILPGGFSFGDYLRTGAIARFSPIMREVIKFANNGGYVLGICNGFQILLESNLLPGVLIKNINLNFICIDTYLKVVDNSSPITHLFNKDEVFKIPIAHGDGNYFADEETLRELKENNQILFKYCDRNGEIN